MAPTRMPGLPKAELGSSFPAMLGAEAADRSLRRRLTNDLRGAIGRGEMALVYQPRINLADGSMAGAEALLRWTHPIHGAIPPMTFIPLAEASDLILRLGGWVLRQATREAAGWPAVAGTVSVNVSARQIDTGLLSSQVAAALADSGLPPARLELELTESLALDDPPETLELLGSLRAAGIGLALDDFGTGYGSLARLRRLPFTALKLDRSFLRRIPADAEDVAVLRAVQGLAVALGLRLVAEGVEQEAQYRVLVELGCAEAQGWLFGRPVPPEVLRQRWSPRIPAMAGGDLALRGESPVAKPACLIPSPSPARSGSSSSGSPSSVPALPD
ncbi:MAG: putative signal transduction protein containing a rane domain, an and a domain [Belnapia sp.]|nr:putative signal transduction protein containing a rane domain, an and a domain [Belnapia sp.]